MKNISSLMLEIQREKHNSHPKEFLVLFGKGQKDKKLNLSGRMRKFLTQTERKE